MAPAHAALVLATAVVPARAGFRRLDTAVLPFKDVDEEKATFYVFRDDIVMFPITYSIPKERILDHVPEKSFFAMNDSMKSFQYKNYQFGPMQEEEYHQHIRKHRFGDTRKKGGFDCLRHYELLANGCIPIFHDLEHLPRSLLRPLPKSLLMEAKALFALPWEATETGPGHCPSKPGAAEDLAESLLRWTSERLSTEHVARYVLDTLNIDESSASVLFLPCSAFDNFPSFLTASVFHGLVSLLGDRVLDVPEYGYAYRYDDSGTDEELRIRSNIWGQGFTLGFKHRPRPFLNRENISQRIRAREFDLIIFGRMSPYEPCNFYGEFGGRANAVPEFFLEVISTYPRERVALLYGDDSGIDDAVVRTQLYRTGGMNSGLGMVFMREMLPFVSEGPAGETLRPVDGRLLQPGCFYKEWLDFFSQWRPQDCDESSNCLWECVAHGRCFSQEIEDHLESLNFQIISPPSDAPALKQLPG
ncbi:hypothetical protein AK812_SmicGene2605 [Symbiodinium microadriaticum]|uniref:Uncharacterized protein n=1 Tax=Symbiodinium microadriaticum TaxID=2951 RepID=A0A1Q9F198_SYMMI|nr:hypothetical protein AK812_SmicGene2605 [Symbiodinium microadriaticum]CAE7744887.1 unnamed protein product [Symbiodinium microadriaticum]